jgi:hypothetical protein
MKRIIDGKRYDTDTATRVACAESSCYRSDFHYWSEDLYRTPRGRWFIHGEGGPCTRWSRPVGTNGRTGSEGIEVLTVAEALEWCERREIDADLIAGYFEIEEG